MTAGSIANYSVSAPSGGGPPVSVPTAYVATPAVVIATTGQAGTTPTEFAQGNHSHQLTFTVWNAVAATANAPVNLNAQTLVNVSGLELGAATAPTHSCTVASAGTGYAHYLTADQTVNYERLVLSWLGGVATLQPESGGSGVARQVRLLAADSIGTFSLSTNGTPTIASTGGSVGNGALISSTGALTASSGFQRVCTVVGSVTQTGTASVVALDIGLTQNSLGSGVSSLIRCGVTSVVKFRVSMLGESIVSSGATLGHTVYNTADETTNFERVSLQWVSNVATLQPDNGGTGAQRALSVGAAASVRMVFTPAAGCVCTGIGGTGTAAVFNAANANAYTSTTQVQKVISVTGTVNQTSGTGGYDAIDVNPTLTAVGSAGANLLRLRAGSTDMLRVDRFGKITASSTVTTAGTTGNITANTPTGTVNIAAAGTTATVTNSLVTADSIVLPVLRTSDTTAKSACAVPNGAGGSFVVTLNAAATAEVSIGWIVIN